MLFRLDGDSYALIFMLKNRKMLTVNASRSTAQTRATEKIGRQMPTGICREKKKNREMQNRCL